jgi:hypothetical protein
MAENTSLFDKLTVQQQSMVDAHLQATTRINRNCESMRDTLEEKYLREVVTRLYGSLNMSPPAIYILDSPLACSYMWSHVPQTVADRWRVFHDEFYTHPLSSPIVDVIQDGFNAFDRLVNGTISGHMHSSVSSKIERGYRELERVGDLVHTAIANVTHPLANSEFVTSFHDQVNKYINNKPIKDSVQRQPVPNIDQLIVPGRIFRGQHYSRMAYYQSLEDLGMPFLGYHKNLIHMDQQMNQVAHWWFPFKNVLIISDRHKELHVDEIGRPHNTKGPAIEYRDGWKIYAWKGILIEKDIIENPDSLTVSRIMAEQNTEVRRVMVDRFGLDRFIVESKSKSLDKQGEYELLEVPYLQSGNMIALKMRCPTTAAVYVHTVHPECSNVEQALAWKRGENDFRHAKPYKEGLIWER